MLWETVTDSCDVLQCTSLFKNAFKIRSTPEVSVKNRPKARRLLGMASRRLSSPETTSPSVDKENGSSNPITHSSSPQKTCESKATKVSRCPLEDCDPNSQDSGYGASFADRDDPTLQAKTNRDGFRFAEPSGVAPRKMSIESRASSPVQSPQRSSPKTPKRRPASFFRSLSTDHECMDDGFNELIDIDSLVDGAQLPNGITSLLSGHIVGAMLEKPMECDAATTPKFARIKKSTILRRSLSLQHDKSEKTEFTLSQSSKTQSPPPSSVSKVRSCLFRSPNATSSVAKLSYNDDENIRARDNKFFSPTAALSSSIVKLSFKRPEPPSTDSSPVLVKRSKKSSSLHEITESATARSVKKTCLHRSYSETEAHAHIKSAINRSAADNDLTGDFSKACILPLADGHHEDLKSITTETLGALMRGEYSETVDSYTIIDCRYPYEYEGGHIEGSLNLYSKDMIEDILLRPLSSTPTIRTALDKRRVLIFHCEFSWERGPNLSRFLRNIDRQRNKEHYPALHYPEVYLLHGGYEEFYRKQGDLCSPRSYRPMKHPDHEADLRQFRNKSKSWQGEKTRLNGLTSRTNLKRLGF